MMSSTSQRLGAPLVVLTALLLAACDQSPPDSSAGGSDASDPPATSEAVDPPASAAEDAPPASSEAPTLDSEEPGAEDAVPPTSPTPSEAEIAEAGQLPEETALAADTLLAARYSSTGAESTPTGVWAVTPEACERIDQEDGPAEFLIVTPSSLRDSISNCTVSPGDISDAAPFTATCIADGQSEERELMVDLIDANTLHYQRGSGDDLEMVRCSL